MTFGSADFSKVLFHAAETESTSSASCSSSVGAAAASASASASSAAPVAGAMIGTAMMCANCHSDEKNKKPTAKFLGEPRNSDYAQEWMGEVMTTKFVELSGKRLKCKTCHGGMAPNTPGFFTDVIKRLSFTGSGVQREAKGTE